MDTEKFERWNQEKKKAFIEVFSGFYNFSLGTDYKFYDNSLQDKEDYDFSLKSDSLGLLKVQHTYAGTNECEYTNSLAFRRLLKDMRASLDGLKNIFLSMVFSNIPSDKDSRDKFCFYLKHLIVSVEGSTPAIFTFVENDYVFLKPLLKYVTSLSILPIKNDRVAYGISTKGGQILSDDIRVQMAIENKKYSHPHDLVLLIHFNMNPVSDFYILPIVNDQKDRKYKNILLYDEWRKDKFIIIK